MKKICIFFAAALVLAASCSKTEVESQEGSLAAVSFDVALADGASKAVGDGATVDKLACAVYDGETLYANAVVDKKDGKFLYSPSLYYGKTYTVVFYAYKDGAYTVNDALTEIKRSGSGEAADAFSHKETVKINADGTLTVDGAATTQTKDNHAVTLTRKFAQLNIGTESLDDLAAVGATKVNVTVTGCPASYNAVGGTYSTTMASVTYTSAVADFSGNSFSVNSFSVNNTSYSLVSADYLFAGVDVDVTIDVLKDDDTKIRTISLTNLPLNANGKTNIYGNLVKGSLAFNVSVSSGFTGSETNKTIDE